MSRPMKAFDVVHYEKVLEVSPVHWDSQLKGLTFTKVKTVLTGTIYKYSSLIQNSFNVGLKESYRYLICVVSCDPFVVSRSLVLWTHVV